MANPVNNVGGCVQVHRCCGSSSFGHWRKRTFLFVLYSLTAFARATSPTDSSSGFWSLPQPGESTMFSESKAYLGLRGENNNDDEEIIGSAFDIPLDYSIFRGQSSLRHLRRNDAVRDWLSLSANSSKSKNRVSKAMVALLLLLEIPFLDPLLSSSSSRSQQQQRLRLDQAHEVILGVTWETMDDAEYAATHPGKTNWAAEHPLDDIDDCIHALIHRMEGNCVGEGGHTGYANAQYWAAGGPKACAALPTAHHPVYQALCRLLLLERGWRFGDLPVDQIVVPSNESERSHKILAGQQERIVRVPPGCWDSLALINLWDESSATTTTIEDSSSSNSDGGTLRQALTILHGWECQLLALWEQRGRVGSAEDLLRDLEDKWTTNS